MGTMNIEFHCHYVAVKQIKKKVNDYIKLLCSKIAEGLFTMRFLCPLLEGLFFFEISDFLLMRIIRKPTVILQFSFFKNCIVTPVK